MMCVVTEKREMVCFVAGDGGRRRGGANTKTKPRLYIYNSYGFSCTKAEFLLIRSLRKTFFQSPSLLQYSAVNPKEISILHFVWVGLVHTQIQPSGLHPNNHMTSMTCLRELWTHISFLLAMKHGETSFKTEGWEIYAIQREKVNRPTWPGQALG